MFLLIYNIVFLDACKTQLLQQEYYIHCITKRKEEIERSRMWYQITNGSHNVHTEFQSPEIPFLNQKMKNVIFHYATDPDEGRFMSLYSTWRETSQFYQSALDKMFENTPFRSFKAYERLHHEYNHLVKVSN